MHTILAILFVAALIGGLVYFVRAREAGKLDHIFDVDRGGSAGHSSGSGIRLDRTDTDNR